METATLIVMLALLEYTWFTLRVGFNRDKFGVNAPATTGNETWERMFRIQQNTMEQLVMFIPATFAFAHFVSVRWVWLPGVMFIVGRFLYSMEYLGSPSSRVPGMSLTLLSNVILIIGTLIALGLRLV